MKTYFLIAIISLTVIYVVNATPQRNRGRQLQNEDPALQDAIDMVFNTPNNRGQQQQPSRGVGVVVTPDPNYVPTPTTAPLTLTVNEQNCTCVPYHMCDPNTNTVKETTNDDEVTGFGLIDIRFDPLDCVDVLDVCCVGTAQREGRSHWMSSISFCLFWHLILLLMTISYRIHCTETKRKCSHARGWMRCPQCRRSRFWNHRCIRKFKQNVKQFPFIIAKLHRPNLISSNKYLNLIYFQGQRSWIRRVPLDCCSHQNWRWFVHLWWIFNTPESSIDGIPLCERVSATHRRFRFQAKNRNSVN